MTFEQMLRRAKGGDQEAITSILLMYRPLLLKYAVIEHQHADTRLPNTATHGKGQLPFQQHFVER